jgi:hypothetical protein
MPTIHGFDEEFGQDPGVTQLDRTHSILLAVALGAAILGGLTLAWLAVDGSVRPKVASETRRQLNRANWSTASLAKWRR